MSAGRRSVIEHAPGPVDDALDLLEALPSKAVSAGLDVLQLALYVVGLVPGLGEPVGAVNLAISTGCQDVLDIGLGVVSLVPDPGILLLA